MMSGMTEPLVRRAPTILVRRSAVTSIHATVNGGHRCAVVADGETYGLDMAPAAAAAILGIPIAGDVDESAEAYDPSSPNERRAFKAGFATGQYAAGWAAGVRACDENRERAMAELERMPAWARGDVPTDA
jgi:hypothetical protein